MIVVCILRRLAVYIGFGVIFLGALVGMDPPVIFTVATMAWLVLVATRQRPGR